MSHSPKQQRVLKHLEWLCKQPDLKAKLLGNWQIEIFDEAGTSLAYWSSWNTRYRFKGEAQWQEMPRGKGLVAFVKEYLRHEN